MILTQLPEVWDLTRTRGPVNQAAQAQLPQLRQLPAPPPTPLPRRLGQCPSHPDQRPATSLRGVEPKHRAPRTPCPPSTQDQADIPSRATSGRAATTAPAELATPPAPRNCQSRTKNILSSMSGFRSSRMSHISRLFSRLLGTSKSYRPFKESTRQVCLDGTSAFRNNKRSPCLWSADCRAHSRH